MMAATMFGEGKQPSTDALAFVLVGVAYRTAGMMGYPFAVGCDQLLAIEAKQAAPKLAAEIHERGIAALADAEAATVVLVRAMVDEAKAHGWTELHEPTLMDAMSKLCPLFPFC